jgi:hypothetical protein
VALFGVEAGTLGVAVGDGGVTVPANVAGVVEVAAPAPAGEGRPSPEPLTVGAQRILGAGATALLPSGGSVTLRNAGAEPVSILVIAIVVAAD